MYIIYIYICSDGVAFLLIKACKCAKNTQRRTKPPVLRKILSQGPDMISHHVQKPEKATTPGTLLYTLFALFLLSLRPIVSMSCFFTCHSGDTWSPLRTSLLIFLFSFLFFLFPGSRICSYALVDEIFWAPHGYDCWDGSRRLIVGQSEVFLCRARC